MQPFLHRAAAWLIHISLGFLAGSVDALCLCVRFTPAITAGGRIGRSAAAQSLAPEDETGRQAGKGKQEEDKCDKKCFHFLTPSTNAGKSGLA